MTEQHDRMARAADKRIGGQVGQSMSDQVLGVFAYSREFVRELVELPSVIFADTLATTQAADGSFPYAIGIDELDVEGLA